MKFTLEGDPSVPKIWLMAILTFLETLIGALIVLLDSDVDITLRAIIIILLTALLPLITTIIGHLKSEEST